MVRERAQHVAKLGDIRAATAEFGRNACLDEAGGFEGRVIFGHETVVFIAILPSPGEFPAKLFGNGNEVLFFGFQFGDGTHGGLPKGFCLILSCPYQLALASPESVLATTAAMRLGGNSVQFLYWLLVA